MRKRARQFQRHWCLTVLTILVWASTALATPPSTPITVGLDFSHAPNLGEWATVTVKVQSLLDAPDTSVEVVLPEGATAQTARWVVDLQANVPVSLSTGVRFERPGNHSISARAFKPVGPDSAWGDMKAVPLHVSPARGQSQVHWKVNQVPVAELAVPGDTSPVSLQPTPFSPPAAASGALASEPSVDPAQSSSPAPADVTITAAVTLTGKWRYHDRSSIARDIDTQLIEIRKGDGSPLSTRAFCFTNVDGTFSCSAAHPGTTMRVWVRSWTNFSFTGGTNRLGVFSGPEVIGGCGSDSIDCAYPVSTGAISCAAGATCNTGTWTVTTSIGEPYLGAHQMTQDLVRSWRKIFSAVRHPAGTVAGPARIEYPVPSGHGTHAHVGSGEVDGWISIEPPNQQSADVVNHEYGHVVMSNLWTNFSPVWPTSDCPSSHFINLVSGPGCALSEGFADFWAWYSNQSYDGDSSTTNDGPVFNWPGGASTNLETRDGGTYQASDRVEGNVAAALGDLLDSANESPTQGPLDRVSDGVQHIWHVVYSQSDNNFSQWWNAYWSTFGHQPCPPLNALRLNTIQYSLSQCPACNGLQPTIFGTSGNNTISGTAGRDIINGLAGNDSISGLGGNDVICGGTGTDTCNGGTGTDTVASCEAVSGVP